MKTKSTLTFSLLVLLSLSLFANKTSDPVKDSFTNNHVLLSWLNYSLFSNVTEENSSMIYEAEEATLHGKNPLIRSCSSASNGKLVTRTIDGSCNSITFKNINATKAGSYDIVLDYISPVERTFTIVLNGEVTNYTIDKSGKWCYQGGAPASKTISVILKEGANTLKIYDIHTLDRITVKKTSDVYHVSTSDGDDSNDGFSPQSPWKSLDRVNQAVLAPGDQILFKSGDTFLGQLNVDHSGTAENPIIFGRYGTGDKPKIDGANAPGGAYLAAIYVNNQEYIEFDNLYITNDRKTSREGVDDLQGYGIYVHNSGTKPMHHFKFSNLTVEGVYAVSTEGQDHDALKTAGIYVKSEKNTVLNEEKYVKDVLVENSYFTNIAKFGFWSQHKGNDSGIGNDIVNRNNDFVFRNNHFYKTGGSGITPGRTYNVLMEHNLIEYPGSDMDPRMAKRGSGAWFFNCHNVIAQYNRVYHARGENDTYGIHIDMKNKYVVVQYNYTEDSEGGFAEILGDNEYATYRYNISVNEGLRAKKGNTLWVSPWSFSQGNTRSDKVYIYNNSIYVGKNTDGKFMNPGLAFESKNVYVYNNTFHVISGSTIGVKELKLITDDGTDVHVDNNLYQGYIIEGFTNKDQNAIFDNPLYTDAGIFEADGYKLQETSPALNAGRPIEEPPFPMAGQGIFKDIPAKATKDYFGNSVDLSKKVHIGAYNGSPTPYTGPKEETPITGNENGIYEAEDAIFSGNSILSSCDAASMDLMVGGVAKDDKSAVLFPYVDVEVSGNYYLDISYITGAARTLYYKINDGNYIPLKVNATGWCGQLEQSVTNTVLINLKKGRNTIKLYNVGSLDKIQVRLNEESNNLIYEAENATLSGNASVISCANASQELMVKEVSGSSQNAVTFSNVNIENEGSYKLHIHYISGTAKTASYSVNNESAQTVNTPATGWCNQVTQAATKTVSIALNKGNNVIKIYNIGSLDKISLEKTDASSARKIVNHSISSTTQEKSDIILYPNIVSRGEFVHLKNTNPSSTIAIYNSSGQLVYKNKTKNSSIEKIHTNKLRSGIYFIKVIDGKQTFNSKIIIK